MITLQELIETQQWTGMSDIQVIKTFFDLNNMEEEAMDLLNDLAKIKIEKLKAKQKMVREWTSYLPSKYLYETYDLDTADALHTLELDFLTHGGELSSGRLDWAKENIPNIKKPQAYFNPLVYWLEEKGIRFLPR